MWGNISTEASYQLNFNVGFSTTRSDVLIHLTQWQYWWWFWFIFLWCFYYLTLMRTVKSRVLKMRPKITTSVRPHGKWGDFLACIVPTIWCVNILNNSNLILKLVEWQSEASLFTIRIRGRQWYWIYKFELKNFTDILTAPKNIGSNHWVVSTGGELQVADDYLHILQLRSQSKWTKEYWHGKLYNESKRTNNKLTTSTEQLRVLYQTTVKKNQIGLVHVDHGSDKQYFWNYMENELLSQNSINFISLRNTDTGINNLNDINIFENKPGAVLNSQLVYKSSYAASLTSKLDIKQEYVNSNSSIDPLELSRWVKRNLGNKLPLRIIYGGVIEGEDLFNIRFGDGTNAVTSKPLPHTKYFSFKQQRMKKKKILPLRKDFKTNLDGKLITTRYSGHQILTSSSLDTNFYEPQTQYDLIKKNRVRGEKISIPLARRLLRTKKILVLPAHINLTAITNSYDVVHSWFIPGLGLKMDCVPGRSTHHTFFIDSVGFYYGQCAEICGRYHHHMPIRICALPFEHFLVWWQSFGAPKLLTATTSNKLSPLYSFRKYSW